MRIVRNEAEEALILTRCKNMLTRSSGKRKEGLHVSDLLSPRLAYFRRILGERMGDKQALYFIAGRGHHDILEALQTWEGHKEMPCERHGIHGTIDTFDGVPIEIKTTRSMKTEDYKVARNYTGQLIKYCVMTNTTWGRLVVFFLSYPEQEPFPTQDSQFSQRKMSPKIKVLDVYFDDTELKKADEDILERKDAIEQAIREKTFEFLPRCDGCGGDGERPWKYKDCLFLPECGKPADVDSWGY